MDWARLLLVDVLTAWAWPIVALVAILVVRPHISAFIGRIKSMKGLGVEVSLEEASEGLAQTEIPAASTTTQAPAVEGPADTSAQFIASWTRLVALLDHLADAYRIKFGTHLRSSSTANQIARLQAANVIDPPLANTISALRNVRNAFVHGDEQFQVSQMVAFVGLAEQVAGRLEKLIADAPPAEG